MAFNFNKLKILKRESKKIRLILSALCSMKKVSIKF